MLKMLRDLVLEPSIVVGGIVFLGLVLQRKSPVSYTHLIFQNVQYVQGAFAGRLYI